MPLIATNHQSQVSETYGYLINEYIQNPDATELSWAFEQDVNSRMICEHLLFMIQQQVHVHSAKGNQVTISRLRQKATQVEQTYNRAQQPQMANDPISIFSTGLIDKLDAAILGITKENRKNRAYYHSLLMSITFVEHLKNKKIPEEQYHSYLTRYFLLIIQLY